MNSHDRFKSLTFDGFRALAADDTLTLHEKIGFPDEYREGKEDAILDDIAAKLPRLADLQRVVLDIGPGCGRVAHRLIERCRDRGHKLILVDSPEMLARLPDAPFIEKVAGRYPSECAPLLWAYRGKVDALITYSVLHYVFVESPLFPFVDASLSLLAPGGAMLIGDIPNISKRKRFFASDAGILHHQEFTGTAEGPRVDFNVLEDGQIDDAVVLGLAQRCRASGFDAYVMPQDPALPMANRREDLLIIRP